MLRIKKIAVLIALCACCAFMFKEQEKITVYLIGDSTVCTQPVSQAPVTGWGTPFAVFFDSSVIIENHARGGRSTRTFLSEGRWQPVVEHLKAGDYVFIQFGHNDEAKEEIYKDRYTSPEDYRKNLSKFIEETKAKNAFPVLVTPVSRRKFSKEGKAEETHVEYSKVMTEVAGQYHVPLLDLDSRSRALYDTLGPECSKLLFNVSAPGANPQYPDGANDGTHFSEFGARKIAELVLDEMKKVNLPLMERVRRVKKK